MRSIIFKSNLSGKSNGFRCEGLFDPYFFCGCDPSSILGDKTNNFSAASPNVDLMSFDDRYELSVAMPGVRLYDIDVTINGDEMVVSAGRNAESEGNEGKYKLQEIHRGEFKRSFKIPEDSDRKRVTADYSCGILLIKMKKMKHEIEPVNVKIKSRE